MTQDQEEEEETRSILQAALMVLSALVLGAGFVYVTYGTQADIDAVKEGRVPRPYDDGQSDDESDTVVLPVTAEAPVYAPMTAKPNGTVIWKVRVAPRTPLVRFRVDAKGTKKPTRIRFSARIGKSSSRDIATIWAGPAAATEISLPAGTYRVGLTTASGATLWNPNTTDAYFLPDTLELAAPGWPNDPPTLVLRRGQKPEITGRLGPRPQPRMLAPRASPPSSVPAQPAPAQPARESDSYEGLGDGASDGGTPTYG